MISPGSIIPNIGRSSGALSPAAPEQRGNQVQEEDISATIRGYLAQPSFCSTLADNRRTIFMIEPLSQSDRANFNSCLSEK
jgi:hypothetical protein